MLLLINFHYYLSENVFIDYYCNSKSFLGLKKASKLTSCGTIPIDDLTFLGSLSKS